MTTPESIVTSLDWSKKLKEAGWPQEESEFWWTEFYNTSSTSPAELFSSLVTNEEWEFGKAPVCSGPMYERTYLKDLVHFAAPTAEEILRRLPDCTDAWFHNGTALLWNPQLGVKIYQADTLANAAAAMYCYLAEQKLLPAAA